MRAKFLFAWAVIAGLVAAAVFGIANIGDAAAVANAESEKAADPARPVSLRLAGEADRRVSIPAEELVGVRLRNDLDELVGEIRAIATDTFTGRTYAVLRYDAPPIRREKDVLVPLDKILARPGDEAYRLSIGRYQIENAERFVPGDFTNTFSAYWAKGNRKLTLTAPVTGSTGELGFLARFRLGLRVIWGWLAG